MKKIFYLLIKIKIIFFLSIFQSKSDTFYYSGGCFWCTEQDFEEFRGVKEVVSGFTGGTTPNPKYYPNQWGDHREAAKVIYDPTEVSFTELVKMMVENDIDLAEKEKILIDKNLLKPTWDHKI